MSCSTLVCLICFLTSRCLFMSQVRCRSFPKSTSLHVYVARQPERVSDQAKRIKSHACIASYVLFICICVQDTGRYEGRISTGPHHLPTRDERHSKETPMADARHDVCSRYAIVILFYLRQLFFAKFDSKVHVRFVLVCRLNVSYYAIVERLQSVPNFGMIYASRSRS
jgi:hypothetical protein